MLYGGLQPLPHRVQVRNPELYSWFYDTCCLVMEAADTLPTIKYRYCLSTMTLFSCLLLLPTNCTKPACLLDWFPVCQNHCTGGDGYQSDHPHTWYERFAGLDVDDANEVSMELPVVSMIASGCRTLLFSPIGIVRTETNSTQTSKQRTDKSHDWNRQNLETWITRSHDGWKAQSVHRE